MGVGLCFAQIGFREAQLVLFFFVFFVLRSQTKVVAGSAHTHLHVLGDLNFEVSVRVARFGLPSINVLESLNKSENTFCIFLHINVEGTRAHQQNITLAP